MTKFHTLVPPLEKYLAKHHELYPLQCKAESWEALCAKSLQESGFGSDWRPDFNHISGVDQITDCGIRISNKGGKLGKNKTTMKISGSRLTSHKTLAEKIEFLKNKTEDYIFCLASDTKEWNNGNIKYYFVVVDANKLDYTAAQWEDKYGTQFNTRGKLVGHKCFGEGFSAEINASMSDQLWTTIESPLFEEFHEIVI